MTKPIPGLAFITRIGAGALVSGLALAGAEAVFRGDDIVRARDHVEAAHPLIATRPVLADGRRAP